MFEQESQALNILLNHLDGAFRKGAFGLQEAFQITDSARTLARFHEEGVVAIANRVLEQNAASQAATPEPTYSSQPEPPLAQPPISETLPPTVDPPHVEDPEIKPSTESPARSGRNQSR